MISTILILGLAVLANAIPFRGPVDSRFGYLNEYDNLNAETIPQSDESIQLMNEKLRYQNGDFETQNTDDPLTDITNLSTGNSLDSSAPFTTGSNTAPETKTTKADHKEQIKIFGFHLPNIFKRKFDKKKDDLYSYSIEELPSSKEDELEFTVHKLKKSQKKDLSKYVQHIRLNPMERYPFTEDIGIVPKELTLSSFVQPQEPSTSLDIEESPINSKWPRYFEEAFFPISPFPDMYDYRIIGTDFKKGIISSPESTDKKIFPSVLDSEIKEESPFQGGPQLFQLSAIEKQLRQSINPPSVSLVLPRKVQATSKSSSTTTSTTPRNFAID